MMIVLLVSWSLAGGQSTGVQYTEKASVGNSVLLLCPCSGMPKELVWQIGDGVVNLYPQNGNDKSSIDESYINRTQLFLHMEKSNCSLLLHNVSGVDSGVYTCYVLTNVVEGVTSQKSLQVNLTVYENNEGSQDIRKGGENKDLTSVHIGIPILAVVLILAAGLLLIQMLRRRRQKKNIVYVPGTVQVNEV